ncbi:hypothetical protein TWF106_007870 [Orbilia oligospora]|uniref:HNH nuclease domain-containing protein n=1 Tax=Orbilia oligospora TaxID=2813651 RepID=A0A7C8URL3_ORBOL|nr:hypothetical protein TWF191_010825 [Orbilia oligospora]KAF3217562.1 hypothetical protein TWF106_007870 [Orbilia oligospora]
MPADRQAGRTVFFFLSSSPNDCIGGCMHHNFTQQDLYVFIDILVFHQAPDTRVGSLPDERNFEIRIRGNNTALENSADIPLSPGDYIIAPKFSSVTLCVSDELYLDRVLSHSVTPRDSAFRDKIRHRDRGCVLSGVINKAADRGNWKAFEAAHIWPLSKGTEWVRQNAGCWITDSDGLSNEDKMNSPQNGILLSSNSHMLFNSHTLAVNPEVEVSPFFVAQYDTADYRVYAFDDDNFGYSGKYMSLPARQNGESGARDTLLQWHFRQSVLANMRGAGEPIWDYGPNEEGDVVGRLLSSDHTMTRLGEEVGARLALTSYLPSSSSFRDSQ